MNGQEWLDRYAVSFDWSANGFHSDRDGWEYHLYTLTLSREGEASPLTFPWRQGLGIDEDPTPDSTLWAIALDVRYGDMDWSEFSREFGYDEFDAPLSQYRAWESCREMHHTVRAWVASEGMWDDFLSIEEGE